jgi:hypothetical protein
MTSPLMFAPIAGLFQLVGPELIFLLACLAVVIGAPVLGIVAFIKHRKRGNKPPEPQDLPISEFLGNDRSRKREERE